MKLQAHGSLQQVGLYLIVTQPDSVVKEVKADDMIMEWLAFGMPSGCGKTLCEHFLHELQVRLLIKGSIKAENSP